MKKTFLLALATLTGIHFVDAQTKTVTVDANDVLNNHTKIVAQKVNSAWPDYVFKKDYQLPSLQEVKAYIDRNQHLPEIPSEQKMV
ncbi:hypothetical protein [Mucilaginibacter sp. NFX135]|uniref:hypothetical protein n=1 Tax=Mucilaginibacter sp. NFX135 TaxID=3402687 RepID=UPI003AFAA0BC